MRGVGTEVLSPARRLNAKKMGSAAASLHDVGVSDFAALSNAACGGIAGVFARRRVVLYVWHGHSFSGLDMSSL